MDKEYIELMLNTKLDLYFSKLEKKINNSSDLKGAAILSFVGISFIVVIFILLKVLTLPIKHIVNSILL